MSRGIYYVPPPQPPTSPKLVQGAAAADEPPYDQRHLAHLQSVFNWHHYVPPPQPQVSPKLAQELVVPPEDPPFDQRRGPTLKSIAVWYDTVLVEVYERFLPEAPAWQPGDEPRRATLATILAAHQPEPPARPARRFVPLVVEQAVGVPYRRDTVAYAAWQATWPLPTLPRHFPQGTVADAPPGSGRAALTSVLVGAWLPGDSIPRLPAKLAAIATEPPPAPGGVERQWRRRQAWHRHATP